MEPIREYSPVSNQVKQTNEACRATGHKRLNSKMAKIVAHCSTNKGGIDSPKDTNTALDTLLGF